jgi:hypothetical protein
MQTIAVEDAEKLRAFEQRMQLEGADAFAAGPAPWEHWDDIGTLGTYQVWNDSVRYTAPEQTPRQPLATRLLTGLAQLSVLTLLVGSAGVYFSIITPEQVASSGIQPPPIVVAGRPGLQPVTTALPVIRARPDTVADTMPANDEPETGDTAEPAPLAVTVVPLQLEPVPDTPATAAGDAAPVEAFAMTLDTLPDTAAGPATETTTARTVAPPAQLTDAPRMPHSPAVKSLPQQIALLTTASDPLPGNAAGRPAPVQEVRELANTWVVNLASYNFESMAKRKLAAFHDKGVNAELVRITVKGKPMIRIRTSGYKSFREANDWAALLEERLELDGAWVAKYQPGEE